MRVRPGPAAVLGALALLAAPSSGDQVLLKNGGHLDGVVVERTATRLTIETGPGRVTLPLDRIVRVVSSTSALAEFQTRAQSLPFDDARGWSELAFWARDHGLLTQARQAFEHVVLVDPRNPTAQAALGRVDVAGRWMTLEESYRSRGLVPYGGEWVTTEERAERLRLDAETERARIEAAARAREADARAAAEAAAARAADASSQGGLPLYGGYGSPFFGGLGPCRSCTVPHRTRPPLTHPSVRPSVVVQVPRPSPPPRH